MFFGKCLPVSFFIVAMEIVWNIPVDLTRKPAEEIL